MSSNYDVLCCSHDPAIEVTDGRLTHDEAIEMASTGPYDHPHCDILVARYSGGLVELGCPPSVNKKRACCHSGVEWAGVAWLRLLASVYRSDQSAAENAAKAAPRCWTIERITRVSGFLGLSQETQPQVVP